MNSDINNSKRIAKNTLLLYLRMFFTMAVSLYTSRVILDVLGVEDFGVYNVIGGVVAMFTILSGSLSAAVSRFLTFELGKGNQLQLTKIFSTSVFIHVVLAIVILVSAEIAGLWFINNKMTIDPSRIEAAQYVLHFSICAFTINLLSVPYNALIIAHERMNVFAVISTIEAVLKLCAVFVLSSVIFDKLVLHSILLMLVAVIVCISYVFYCLSTFKESELRLVFEKELVRTVGGFAAWNFLGSATGVLRSHGINILINIFCGPVVNAARGISFQVNNAVTQFATNFMKAINPQITKSYASRNYDYLQVLISQGARLSYYMLLFVSLPIIVETKLILALWLKEVPEHTILFVRLILLFSLIESLSGTMITAMLATGRIKKYQIVISIISFMNVPTAYLVLKLGAQPEMTVVVMIFYSVCMLIARVILLNEMIQLSAKKFLLGIVGRVLIVSVIAFCITYSIASLFEESLLRVLITAIISSLTILTVALFLGCTNKERIFLKTKVQSFVRKY